MVHSAQCTHRTKMKKKHRIHFTSRPMLSIQNKFVIYKWIWNIVIDISNIFVFDELSTSAQKSVIQNVVSIPINTMRMRSKSSSKLEFIQIENKIYSLYWLKHHVQCTINIKQCLHEWIHFSNKSLNDLSFSIVNSIITIWTLQWYQSSIT